MEHRLETPVPEGEIRRLEMGDLVYLSGTIITARDEAHLKALEMHERGEEPPIDFGGVGIFHCGPIMRRMDGGWEVVAAGPTTSARMEIFEDRFIEAFRPAVIIGKGGMGARTARACAEHGCAYGAFTGGAALLAARGIRQVRDVFWLEELGMPECLWVYEAEDFGPMIVTIDTHGNNMTESLMQQVLARKRQILEALGG
ncbi:fumarate hydratase [miscellaneous Crenarchaeota group-15 archaeon DG-45]|uniref:Fumarate hydratase n=1 Tax=miscellaneous Crenarchaeota group-15 archaeon DG-45 TaxID=1685127 RepID=A0A0M0BQE5_9ARCH|nr:MAG: fumarate hydratase [miscellaneous Crenarchaeota group-15 archaeon DG-45]